uniref:Uncharacterized protein n=1 Tax=Arundo donax TaxID=35708 RepID=A0A0A8YEZ3_ARUDO
MVGHHRSFFFFKILLSIAALHSSDYFHGGHLSFVVEDVFEVLGICRNLHSVK